MKIQEPTLLRMFTINDQAFRAKDGEEGPPLRTDLIEPVELADGKGKASRRMGQWLQHVHLLGVLQEPLAFDLMFVDIKFEKDPWAPGYGDGSVNPMGFCMRSHSLRSKTLGGRRLSGAITVVILRV